MTESEYRNKIKIKTFLFSIQNFKRSVTKRKRNRKRKRNKHNKHSASREMSCSGDNQHLTSPDPEEPHPAPSRGRAGDLQSLAAPTHNALNSPPHCTNRFKKGSGKFRGWSPLPAWSHWSDLTLRSTQIPDCPGQDKLPWLLGDCPRASPSRGARVDAH